MVNLEGAQLSSAAGDKSNADQRTALADAAQLAGSRENCGDIPVDPTLQTQQNNNNNQQQQQQSPPPPTEQQQHQHQHQHQLTPSNTLTAEAIEQSLSPYRVGKNWACRVCGRQFTRRFNCTTHERTHLDLSERAQFQCGLCEHAFTRRHDLKRHIHSVHPGHALKKGTNQTMKLITLPSSDQNHLQSMSPPNLPLELSHQSILSCSIPSDPLRNPDQVRILVIDPSSTNPMDPNHHNRILMPSTSSPTMNVANSLMAGPSTSIQIHNNKNDNGDNNNNSIFQPPTAILTSGSIREVSQAVERVPLDQLSRFNPNHELIFKYDGKWACGTCGRIFIRRNNCKAHEATHRDIRQHQCSTCSRSFSRKHDLERHILAVHPEIDLSEAGTTSANRGAVYDSSGANSNQKKRKKQQETNETEDWMAIDPMILSLDHQQEHHDPPKSNHSTSHDNMSNNEDATRRFFNYEAADYDSRQMQMITSTEVNNRNKRRARSLDKNTKSKSSRVHSISLDHLSHVTTHDYHHHHQQQHQQQQQLNNTMNSFNIFEAFDPSPTLQTIHDLPDTHHTHYSMQSTLPFNNAPIHTPSSECTLTTPIHPPSPEGTQPLPFDPRLFS